MKKFLFSVVAATTIFTASADLAPQAATVTDYEAVVFKDEVNPDQYNYLEQRAFLRAVSQNLFPNGVIDYTHLKLPTGQYYTQRTYLRYLSAAYKEKKGFSDALQSLSDNEPSVTNVTFVKGKMENGKVIAAEPVVKEFKVINIQ